MVDVAAAVELEEAASVGQVVGDECGGRAGPDRGSVMPNEKLLGEARLLEIDADFQIVAAVDHREVAAHAPVEKLPRLALGGGRVLKRVAAAVERELVFADVRIQGEERVRAEYALVAGRDAPGHDALALVLAELIVGIGDLNPVARGEQVEMNRVAAVRLEVDAVEDGLVVAGVMEGRELGRVEKAAGAGAFPRRGSCRSLGPPKPKAAPPCTVPNEPYAASRLAEHAGAPSPLRVVIWATRLVLSPNSESGAPVVSSMPWIAPVGSCVEKTLLC